MMKTKESFFSQVYTITRLIPYGRVSSYGAIARYLAAPRSARMVGYALNGSLAEVEFVPAHRVVNRQGLLTGKRYFGGNTMQELLENEGIQIIENQIQNFQEVFWDPNAELR